MPDGDMSIPHSIIKRREDATIQCPKTFQNSYVGGVSQNNDISCNFDYLICYLHTIYFQEIGITMATPCNNVFECNDRSDESGCKIADWYLYSILSLAAIVLGVTCFVSLQKHVKKVTNEIMQDRRWRLATENENSQIVSSASEKLMKVAFHAENASIDEVNKLFTTEMRIHMNEARVICCLKVRNFRQMMNLTSRVDILMI